MYKSVVYSVDKDLRTYVAEMSCSQLLLTVGLLCTVHAHQDQLTSYLNAATSPYDTSHRHVHSYLVKGVLCIRQLPTLWFKAVHSKEESTVFHEGMVLTLITKVNWVTTKFHVISSEHRLDTGRVLY